MRPVIAVDHLTPHLGQPSWAIVDCRFTLTDPDRGERDYLSAHIPGAVYAHADRDLAGPVVPGRTGRHPLPDVAVMANRLGAWGIDDHVTVVAYDDAGGSTASRLWWLLRWLGHEPATVLDGGWQAWTGAGRPVRSGPETRPPRAFTARPDSHMVASADDVARAASDPDWRVLDARSADRYRGQNETIDPVAGHIPGALSAPWLDNVHPDGSLKSPHGLRDHYLRLTDGVPAERTIVYCGSGITATHDVLAMSLAGLGMPRLYAGSWSEWITDPGRPVARERPTPAP